MMLTLLMLAQAATAAPPPAQNPTDQKFNMPPEVPIEAVREGLNGIVRADLTVSSEGRVSACKIVQSSGHKLLDDFTCSELMRAKFTPAKDETGKPIESHYITPPITYALRN